MDTAKKMTGSQFGFVGYVDPKTGFLVSTTLTRDIWDQCNVENKEVIFTKCAGLWGWVLKNRKSLLANTPTLDPRSSNTPPGHIPIDRFLSAPSVINGELVGQIALANPPADYTQKDLALVERLAGLYAMAIERNRAVKKLGQSEKKYRDLVANSLVGVYRTSLRGDILYLNDAFVQMLGFESVEEMKALGMLARYRNKRDRSLLIETVRNQGSVENFETDMLKKDGTFIHVILSAVLDGEELSGMIMDITNLKNAMKKLRSLSLMDELTGLYNRRGFKTLAEQKIREARRKEGSLNLLYIDLDMLKRLNDDFGHSIGDLALESLGAILRDSYREADLIARIGGDEFVVLHDCIPGVEFQDLLARLQKNITLFNEKEILPIPITVSVGHAHSNAMQNDDIDALMTRADEAMYEGKKRKRLELVKKQSNG